MKTVIKKITLQNFKGCTNATYTFDGKNVTVCGANGSGKTTIFDAFTWLLFGKDSLDNAKFEIRPLDKDGKQIDNVEICVAATLEIDGKEVELKKTQKQNWVKKRGTQNPVLQGNVNEYEIDGYPRSEKDYKEYINGIVSDDLFKMLTNPTYFPNMPWKDQRATIMKFASDVSDVELATGDSRFAGLLPEIEKAPSTDDIKAKYQKSLNELKKKQAEIPVRIDEAEKQMVDIDLAELELEQNAVQELLNSNVEKQKNSDLSSEDYNKIHTELMELKFAQSDFTRKANESNIAKRQDIAVNISGYEEQVRTANRRMSVITNDIIEMKSENEKYNSEIARVREQWNATKNSQFDENEQICTLCGQILPADKISANRAEFEERKKKDLAQITERGNRLKDLIDNNSDKIKELESERERLSADIEYWTQRKAELEQQLSKLPTSVDVSADTEYLEIGRKIEEKLSELRKFDSAEDFKRELRAEETELRNRMAEIKAKFAKAEANLQIDDRITELRSEQREVAQKIAYVEKMLYLLDEFIKYKLDKISDSINAMFDGVNWKLFSEQINGGMKEVCEVTYNGVPFQSLNNGHRIIAGLQIIKALQKLYGAYLPIFIDNAESVNDFNLPDMDCQLIKLKVSDDNELKVEVE